ncbi:S8 family serine peptidase [Catellatospora sp. KI3]|uniref:S8 family serine peptidase n=1 Tax=Catellatospora sp. KI3 TaxID=3041620 RepID=UPI002482BE50|nr:S8 family serine peptidase [Catellatospora sp. KI3]MDI1459922.1 S8 family serine peptidase [Catellatospora sp. KI3]
MRRLLRTAAVLVTAAATIAVGAAPAHADRFRDDQWFLGYLDLAKAHAISQGEGVTVAVIDSGVEARHPDLAGNVLTGIDVVTGGSGNGWGDLDGHGTGMAGLIAAHGHGSGDGVLGVAPKAKIFPIRMANAAGMGNGDAIVRGINEAVSRKIKIISISVSAFSSVPDDLIDAVARAREAGTLVFAASGNAPEDFVVTAPARYPGAVAVGAVDRGGNHMGSSVSGPEVLLSAPGADITSTSKINKSAGTQYRRGSGTSPATAIAAGVAALVWSKYPTLTADQVLERLTRTSVDKGPQGQDGDYGFGVVDPVAALTAPDAAPSTEPTDGSVATFSASELPDTGDGDGSRLGLIALLLGAVVVAGGVAVVVGRRVRR